MNVLPKQKKAQVWNLSFSETSLLAFNNPFFPRHSPIYLTKSVSFSQKSVNKFATQRSRAILRLSQSDWKACCTIADCSASVQFSSVQSLSRVRLFVTPWIAAHQASPSITNSRSSLRLTSIESVMPSSHLILCRPLLLLPSIPPSIRVFSNESTLHIGCIDIYNCYVF